MSEQQAIEAGRAAWQRVSKREVMQFEDWCAIGRALIVIRTQVMMEANLNKPFGGKYNRVMGAALAKHGLAGISTGERHRIVRIVENLPEVEAWRASLSPEERRRQNHPSQWIRFQCARKLEQHRAGLSSLTGKPRSHAQGRLIAWPQDMIRRAATAMREKKSNDLFVLARAALEGAIRDDYDLISLLPAPKNRAPAQTIGQDHAQRVHPEYWT
jgi:hypothetical protein